MQVIPRLTEWHSEMTAWRHELHAHPQTAFEETFASEFIASKLQSWGIETHRGLAKTGVVGIISGRRVASPSSPDEKKLKMIGLRADIDALDIEEQNDIPYRSIFRGKMHACGHDGHTAMLLGAARYLAETRNFTGSVCLIFQPAEENEGGGRVMVQEGLFDRFPCDAVFGMHNWPGIPVGQFGVCSGPIMAAFDVFEIIVRGQGTHAAMPHLGVDPIVVSAQIVTALQTIASRNVNPLDQVVLSVTQIHGGDTWNVIPTEVKLRGTVRTFRQPVQDMVEATMRRIVMGIAASFGGSAELLYDRRYPATINTPRETEWAGATAVEIAGVDHVDTNVAPCMGSEDFAFLLQKSPGCYLWTGNGPSDNGRVLHNPKYDFNDQVLIIGATYWSRLAERLLSWH
ncbi:MAG: M20 family metallopeptidase [Planctomycetales bacterium]|nr:M20 family metallopeptidase [Planctomycetales bacterium]